MSAADTKPRSKRPYDYAQEARNSASYERNGSTRGPVKRVLRKLVREAARMAHDPIDSFGSVQTADEIARRLVP